MSLIDLDDLKSVLGVGDIYPDAELQSCADAAADTVSALLTFKSASITAVSYDSTLHVATYYTANSYPFSVGESVNISTYIGSPFDGTQVVLSRWAGGFTTTKTHVGDHVLTDLKPFGLATATLQANMYDTVEAVRQAVLAVAVDIFQTRLGTAGQTGLDFQPAPYRMGKSMYSRVSGLLGRYMDSGAFIA